MGRISFPIYPKQPRGPYFNCSTGYMIHPTVQPSNFNKKKP